MSKQDIVIMSGDFIFEYEIENNRFQIRKYEGRYQNDDHYKSTTVDCKTWVEEVKKVLNQEGREQLKHEFNKLMK